MIDIEIDDRLDIVLTPGNDPARVTGTAAHKQALRLAVIAYFDSIIGELDRQTAFKKMEVQAKRIASSLGFIGSLAAIRVYPSESEPDATVVELTFTDGETETFEVA